MKHQNILITGATDGLGKALALDLADKGYRLLLHGRDQSRLEEVADQVLTANSAAKVSTYLADFSSLESVRQMAQNILAQERNLHVLINNAGVGAGQSHEGRRLSQDAYELRLQVNYLGAFLLTHSLLPLLKASTHGQEGQGGPRIVNVASVGQRRIDFDNLMLDQGYSGINAYSQSKLALIMFSFDLSEQLEPYGIPVNALHPATLMPTKMTLEAFGYGMASIDEGVMATKRLAVGKEGGNVTGKYFEGQRLAKANAQAYDTTARQKLKTISMKLVRLQPVPSTF